MRSITSSLAEPEELPREHLGHDLQYTNNKLSSDSINWFVILTAVIEWKTAETGLCCEEKRKWSTNSADGRIIQNWISNKWYGRMCTGLS